MISKTLRTRKLRHRENQRLKFGNSAVTKHKRLGGRTGSSMHGRQPCTKK